MKVLLFLIVFVIKNVLSYNISDLYKLPKIYKMENYTNCMIANNLYCELEFDVKPVENDTDLWKIIQISDAKDSLFDRKILYRAMCLPRLYENNEAKLIETGLTKIKNELKLYNLDADLTYIHCKKTFTYKLYEYILLGCLFIYFSWIIAATYIDYFRTKLRNKYVEYFSIIYNCNKLLEVNKNSHYNRLKFMQGIRLYSILGVILTHSLLSYSLTYTENTEFLENIYSYKPITFLIHFCSFLVQIFFVLSGWLSILKIRKYLKFSVKNIVVFIYNRVVRFLPTVLFYLCIWTSNIFFSYDIPLTKHVNKYYKNCCKGWFYVFIQNWLYSSDFCNYHLWTISLDIQGFIILLITFYIVIKYKISFLKSLITLCLLFIIIQINIIYVNDFNMHFKFLPRNLLPLTRKRPLFTFHYMSFFTNVPSYLIGSIFGILYLRNTFVIVLQKFWLLTCITIIDILCIIIATLMSNKLASSILGGFMKPLFATATGFFLFDLAQNPSAKFKKIYENRIVEILGTCTQSIHVFHMCFILTRCYETHFPVKMVFRELVLQLLGDQIKSIIAGVVIYLTVEQPFAMLIKWNYKEKEEKEN